MPSVGVFAGVLIASLAGYAFRRYGFFAKKMLFVLVLAFGMVYGSATTLPLSMMSKHLKLPDTKLDLSSGPLIVDDAYQVPRSVELFKGQPQALPIHAAILGVKAGKIVLNDNGVGIYLKLVL